MKLHATHEQWERCRVCQSGGVSFEDATWCNDVAEDQPEWDASLAGPEYRMFLAVWESYKRRRDSVV